MRWSPFVLLALCLVAVAGTFIQIRPPLKNRPAPRGDAPYMANARIVEAYGKLPISFEANHGQTDPEVKFLSRGNGYSLFLTATEAVVSLKKPANQSRERQRPVGSP